MTVKEYLSQYRTLDIEINGKLEQVEQLRALAAKVSPSTGFGSSGGISDRVGKTVAKIIDLENEINDDIDKLIDLKKEIKNKVNDIPCSKYRVIIEKIYFNDNSIEQVAEELNYSARQIRRFLRHTIKTYFNDVTENVLECP